MVRVILGVMSWTASLVLAAGLLGAPGSGIPGDNSPLTVNLCNPWEASVPVVNPEWTESASELVDPWAEEARARLELSDALIHPWEQL